jgi:hypothetical protein
MDLAQRVGGGKKITHDERRVDEEQCRRRTTLARVQSKREK